MLKNVTSPEKNVRELELLIEKDTFDAACEKAFRKNAGSINVPGFRKGKAPRAIIEKMYGKGVFYDDAINSVLPEIYENAVKESGISPVGRPEFSVDTIDENGVTIKTKTYVKPEVELKAYRGLEAEKTVAPVTDEDIDREIGRVRERNAREIEITDRPAQKGDTVTLDFEGFADGKAFDGGKSENYNLKLGSGQFIPGFEDQVAGHRVGENFDINVTFPEEYGEKALAGKPAVFKIALHAIKEEQLPELDDEFAKDVSEFDTFAEYKADVKAKIAERNEQSAEREFEGKLIDKLIENLEADIPECMFDDECERFAQDYEQRLKMQGLSLDMYFKYTGSNMNDLRTQFRPQAERQVKTNLALEKVAELEKLEAGEDEIKAKAEEIAKNYGMTAEEVLKAVPEGSLAEEIKTTKAIDIIKSSAVTKPAKKKTAKKAETEAQTEEKPAAKKTAKKAESDSEAIPAAKKTAKKAEGESKAESGEKPAAKKATKKTEGAAPAEKKPAAKKTSKKEEGAE